MRVATSTAGDERQRPGGKALARQERAADRHGPLSEPRGFSVTPAPNTPPVLFTGLRPRPPRPSPPAPTAGEADAPRDFPQTLPGPSRGRGALNACAACTPAREDGPARPLHPGGGAVRPGPRPGASGPALGPASSSPGTARSREPTSGTGLGAPGSLKEGAGPGGAVAPGAVAAGTGW